MPSPSLPNVDPIELTAPDISPFKRGNVGIDYITTFKSDEPGPHVMISAIVHGNELCGPIALEWLFKSEVRPLRGMLSLAFINIAAYDAFDPADPSTTRFVDEDLNRVWASDVLDDTERTSIELVRAREVRPFLETVDTLLDIHSMQRKAPPMMMAGAHKKGRVLARAVGSPAIVITDSGHAAGQRMRDYNGFGDPDSTKNALLVECGQHWEANSAPVALDVTARFLRATGVVAPDFGADIVQDAAEQTFAEVTEAVTIQSEDGFTFAQEFQGGEMIEKAGTLLGHDGSKPVVTPYDNCLLVMPTRRTYKDQTAVRLARIIDE